MRYFLYFEVCQFFLFLWIVFCCSCSSSICILTLINIPTLFNFQCINFWPISHMDKSLSFIKFIIIMCELVFHMKDSWKDCNGVVKIFFNAKPLHFHFENLTLKILFNFEVTTLQNLIFECALHGSKTYYDLPIQRSDLTKVKLALVWTSWTLLTTVPQIPREFFFLKPTKKTTLGAKGLSRITRWFSCSRVSFALIIFCRSQISQLCIIPKRECQLNPNFE